MSLSLAYVWPEQVTEEDIQWLEKADAPGPAFTKIPFLKIDHWLKRGEMHLFRFNPGPGLVLVEVRIGPSGLKRLGIVRVAGLGVVWTWTAVLELLQHTAREWGCQQIESMVYNPALAGVLHRWGAKAEAVNMVVEV